MPRKTASENVVCLCRLLNILTDFSNLFLHTGKQCGPRSDSSLIWVHTVCKNDFKNDKEMTKQMTVVVTGALRVKKKFLTLDVWADILNTENKKLQVIGERIKLKQTDEREY